MTFCQIKVKGLCNMLRIFYMFIMFVQAQLPIYLLFHDTYLDGYMWQVILSTYNFITNT